MRPRRYLPPGRALATGAIALMLMLCLSWGFNQIAVKLALPTCRPDAVQALIRSARRVASDALVGGRLRARNSSRRDGHDSVPVCSPALFGVEVRR